MTLIDNRGRLLGRLNLVDAGVAVLAIAAVAGLIVAYQVFRLPRGPEVASVEPATQPAVDGARVTLRGRDFLPYQRVFLRRSGDAPGFVHDEKEPADAYTLVNHTQARWVVESPSLAAVRLPDQMGPGTYDLLFFNETRQISTARAAFVLTAAAPLPPVRPTVAIVRLEGAFTRLLTSDALLLVPGARLVSDRPDESMEIIAAERPQPDVARLTTGSGPVPAPLEGRQQVAATVRVRCTVVAESECRIGGAALAADSAVTVRLGEHRFRFLVIELASDFADATGEVDVTVRFVLRPSEAALMKAGDADAADAAAARQSRRQATLASIGSRADVTRRTFSTVDGTTQWIEEPAVRVDAVLRVPVTRLDGVWFYKGQALKSGGTIAFETPTYKARAWVLNVAVHAPASGRSSE